MKVGIKNMSSNDNPTKFFTADAKKVLSSAQSHTSGNIIYPVHILLSLIDADPTQFYRYLEITEPSKLEMLRAELVGYSENVQGKIAGMERNTRAFSNSSSQSIVNAAQEAVEASLGKATEYHLLLGILKCGEDELLKITSKYSLAYSRVRNFGLPDAQPAAPATPPTTAPRRQSAPVPQREAVATAPRRAVAANSALAKFGTNLTAKAQNNELDKVFGRDKEIARVIHILARRQKNNPVLVGDPGVGKTAIVEGLAQALLQPTTPRQLQNKMVYSIDLSAMVAGARYRGDFEERLKGVLEEAGKRDDIILFFDEIHTLRGAGAGEGAMDASNMMKPYLARGVMRVVGATTQEEYRQQFEKDGALARRFQAVKVDEPTEEVALQILRGLAPVYAQYHSVVIGEDAVEAAVKLSSRYMKDRFLPDKAIDILDEAAAKAKLEATSSTPEMDQVVAKIAEIEDKISNLSVNVEGSEVVRLEAEKAVLNSQLEKIISDTKVVTPEKISEVIASALGIPSNRVTMDETRRLLFMERTLGKRIIGQTEALKALSKTIRRQRTGLKSPNRPAGSFIFAGPTGVGKTEVAKALAEFLFGDEKSLITVDMSEYAEKHSVSRLFGAAPGYVGYEQGGQLTEKIKQKPFSVILFDEIEKAHPDVYDSFLQILEEGRMTDGQGREIDFRNTVIIMTTNLGATDINRPASGFQVGSVANDYARMKEKVMKALKDRLRPEFINRLDEILVFPHLTSEQIRVIVDKMVGEVNSRLAEDGHSITLTDSAKDLLAELGYDKNMGARPLRRQIVSNIEDVLSETLLFSGPDKVHSFEIDAVDGVFLYNGETREQIEAKIDELALEFVD